MPRVGRAAGGSGDLAGALGAIWHRSVTLRKGTTADLALPLCGMCPGERLAGVGA